MDDKPNLLEIALRLFVVVAMAASAWQGYRRMRQAGSQPSPAGCLATAVALLVYMGGLAFSIYGIFKVDETRLRLGIAAIALLWGAGGLYGLVRLEAWLRLKPAAVPPEEHGNSPSSASKPPPPSEP